MRASAASSAVAPPVSDKPRRRLSGRALSLAGLAFCIACVGLVAGRWIAANPRIAGWDELQYILLVVKDAFVRQAAGWGPFRDGLFNDYRWATPGPRLLGLPLSLAGLATPGPLRAASAGLLLLCLGILFDALRRLTSIAPAAAATALVAVSPQIATVAENYMSEAPLMPAIAGLLWCFVRESEDPPPRLWNAALMGACVGAGLLARFSFVPIAAGVALALAWQFAASPDRERQGARLLVAGLAAALIAWPFYAYDGVRYAKYTQFALTYPLDHLVASGRLDFARQWLGVLAFQVFGVLAFPAVALGVVLAIPAMAPACRRGWRSPDARVLAFAASMLIAGSVFVGIATHANQNPRYLVGVLPVLAIPVALGFARVRALAGAGLLLAVVQAGLMAAFVWLPPSIWPPLRGFSELSHRANVTCDFAPILDLARQTGQPAPLVRMIGSSDAFNHVQLEMQGYRHGLPLDALPTPITPDPDAEIAAAAAADLLLILSPDVDAAWPHPAIPNPNRDVARILGAVRQNVMLTEVKLANVSATSQCDVLAFVPRQKLDPAARERLLRALH